MTLTRILLAATPVPQARGDGGVGGRRVEGERGGAVIMEHGIKSSSLSKGVAGKQNTKPTRATAKPPVARRLSWPVSLSNAVVRVCQHVWSVF